MFAKAESYYRRLRQRLSRREWAIRHLRLSTSEDTGEDPGLLLIQLDGLGRGELERALGAGRMPFLKRLLLRDDYKLHDFYSGLPSTTPAVQAELYYGVRAAVPAFAFFDRTKKKHGWMCDPEWAKDVEAACAAQGEGLLRGGSSWSCIYSGGSEPRECNFCATSISAEDVLRGRKIRNFLWFAAFHLPSAFLILLRLIFEMGVAVFDLFAGVARGERLVPELKMAASRVFIGTGLREVVRIGGAIDVTRGLPVVHVNFLGYDEQAHRRGPNSLLAHDSLRGIDSAIRSLYYAAQVSRRRDYSVWIFSDHGQEKTQSFADRAPGGIEQIVRECLEVTLSEQRRFRSQRRPLFPPFLREKAAKEWVERWREENELTDVEEATFTLSAMGPLGHLYFSQIVSADQRADLARKLVTKGGVPGVLMRGDDDSVCWFHQGGETDVPEDAAELLAYAGPRREAMAEDLASLARNPHAGDLVLLGWSPGSQKWSFAPERGAHGGIGPEETRGFLLVPPHTQLPDGSAHYVRPAALRAAALHHLKRASLAMPPSVPASGDTVLLRLMTYNTHGCEGVDGRVSPRRIARVIASQNADIIALQEMDLGRRRSRAEDQASVIARELHYHAAFCPTVTVGNEHYGHAVLSRWPIETVRRAFLPSDPDGWFDEPRSAMWIRIVIGNRKINCITTHLGLGIQERVLQMDALLGPEWIGGIPGDEDIILCGDFNAAPGTAPYKMAARRLVDVQRSLSRHRPLRTFTSIQPFARIDHVFVSASLSARRIRVPRTGSTRVASDHLPLVVDLVAAHAAVETTMPKSA